jgi:general secretion pathway protein K
MTVNLSTGAARARFSDEGGRIDVGKAPQPVLAALLRFAGAPDREADGIAQEIVEWRRNVAGSSETAADPPNASVNKSDTAQPFADLSEVAQVPGIAPEWLGAMRPLTTVFAALPGVNRVLLQTFLAARRSSPADADRLKEIVPSAAPYLTVKPQRVVAVELTAALTDGYAAAARAVIVLLPQDSQPYRVLVWKPMPSSVLR